MDLKRNIYLDDTAIEWVNNTLNGLTEDEKNWAIIFPNWISTERSLNHLRSWWPSGLIFLT